MKDYQLQTPKKENQPGSRRSKAILQHSKQPQKISKKCLNSLLASVSEDISLELPKDSIEYASIFSEDNQLGDSAESFVASPVPVILPSSETVTPSDLTPLSSTITTDNDEVGDMLVNRINSAESKSSADIVSVEAEMVVHHLKQAVNSSNADLQSKKLLGALIDLVIQEFNALPEEKDGFAELVSMKARVVLLSFFLWILAVWAVLLFSSGVGSSFSEPPPT